MAARALFLILLTLPAGAKPESDALSDALDAMGIAESDLGYRPLAHWGRYPHPKTTPYVLPFFEDLLAKPVAVSS